MINKILKNFDDNNTCGPKSATIFLQRQGYNYTQQHVENVWRTNVVPSKASRAFGTSPREEKLLLDNLVNQGTTVRRQNITFADLCNLLSQGKNVLCLVRVGTKTKTIYLPFKRQIYIPIFHWITVTGFDQKTGTIFYIETNGTSCTVSQNLFTQQSKGCSNNPCWNWIAPETVLGYSMSYIIRKFSSTTVPKTAIWID